MNTLNINLLLEEGIKALTLFVDFCKDKGEDNLTECKCYFQQNIESHLILPFVEWDVETSLYRTRIDIRDDENIDIITPFSYNPDKCNCKLGRMNIPGQSVFYASQSLKTSIDECKIHDDAFGKTTVYCSEWRIRNGCILRLFPALVDDKSKLSIDVYQQDEILLDIITSNMKEMFNSMDSTLFETYCRLFGKIMLAESYVPSAIIADYLYELEDGKFIDGIIYASQQSKSSIIYDIAIKASSVDECLLPVKVRKGILTKGINNHYILQYNIEASVDSKGNVNW